MHSYLTILLPTAAVLSPVVLSAPAPEPGVGTSLAIAGLAAYTIANSNSGSTSGPDGSYDYTTTSTYDFTKPAQVPDYAADPAWKSSMIGCLGQLNVDIFNGAECLPNKGDGVVLGDIKFGFWKGHDDFDDAVDCYNHCQQSLSDAINAGQVVKTACQYEYKTPRAGVFYKTHTCTMGYQPEN